jgi:glycosyltransferase involved in cell wall biosynthesis
VNLQVSVVVPTLNEEPNIKRAARSAHKLGPICIVDAGTTDRTRALAAAVGAHKAHERQSVRRWAEIAPQLAALCAEAAA